MRRKIALVLAVPLGLLLGAVLAAVGVGRAAPAGHVYTVAQVQAGLARHPAAWVGRTLLVRGIAIASAWSLGPTSAEAVSCDTGARACPLTAPGSAAVHLVLVASIAPRAGPDDVLFPVLWRPHRTALLVAVHASSSGQLGALLRHLPLVGSLFSAVGRVPGGVPRVYRVQILATAHGSCPQALQLCDDARLVDMP